MDALTGNVEPTLSSFLENQNEPCKSAEDAFSAKLWRQRGLGGGFLFQISRGKNGNLNEVSSAGGFGWDLLCCSYRLEFWDGNDRNHQVCTSIGSMPDALLSHTRSLGRNPMFHPWWSLNASTSPFFLPWDGKCPHWILIHNARKWDLLIWMGVSTLHATLKDLRWNLCLRVLCGLGLILLQHAASPHPFIQSDNMLSRILPSVDLVTDMEKKHPTMLLKMSLFVFLTDIWCTRS